MEQPNNLIRQIKRIIYRYLVGKYINGLNPEYDPAKKTILALNHFYDQDLFALARVNEKYNFIIVDAPRLVRGGKLFFSNDVIQINAPYVNESEANRRAWKTECRHIFKLLNRRFNINLIITPSDIFWWIRELIAVGHDHDIKTFVIDKEGLISPFDFDAEAKRIRERAPFISDHIFVWSDRQKQYWQKIGVPEKLITVLGQPRSDLFHCQQNEAIDKYFNSSRPLITLFSYEDTAYVPPYLARQGINWNTMKTETHDFIFDLAKGNPKYNFVIKTHPQQSDLAFLHEKYQLDNLAVIGGAAVANELIQRSELIIAFQTTGVIEAMFMNKKVIYTCWDENYRDLINDILPFHDAPGIVTAKSFEDFKKICQRFFNQDRKDFNFSEENIKKREAFINKYLHKPDGHVSSRFFEAIDTMIQ
ncbi:MAG: hypothetical protein ABIE07_06580 [Candidatus Zixiibacteriota bacterium]